MSVQLSAHVREEIDRWVAKFPPDRKRSAVISALHAVQHENNGYLTTALMDAVAEYLGLHPIQVYEGATFYFMIEKKLGIKTGESTPDGRIYLKREEECLAACNNAPMLMVDHVYHENLVPESVDKILDDLK